MPCCPNWAKLMWRYYVMLNGTTQYAYSVGQKHVPRNPKVILYFQNFNFHTVHWAVKQALPSTNMYTCHIRLPCFSLINTHQYLTHCKCNLVIFSLHFLLPLGHKLLMVQVVVDVPVIVHVISTVLSVASRTRPGAWWMPKNMHELMNVSK